MTNFEKIRSMSVEEAEELAKLLYQGSPCEMCVYYGKRCSGVSISWCGDGIREWLNEEAYNGK